jgi:hypothetical protein
MYTLFAPWFIGTKKGAALTGFPTIFFMVPYFKGAAQWCIWVWNTAAKTQEIGKEK